MGSEGDSADAIVKEGTRSQGTRTMGSRRSRYLGRHKTDLGHIAIAPAMNIMRRMN